MTSRLKRAAKAFRGQIREIRAEDIDKWICGMDDTGNWTRNNYRMAMVTLFSYARDKNYLARGERSNRSRRRRDRCCPGYAMRSISGNFSAPPSTR